MGREECSQHESNPLASDIRAATSGTQPLTIQFVGRSREIGAALDHLLPQEDDGDPGRTLVVHGDSGTGKTYFARELMLRAHAEQPDALFLCVDVANDEYQSSRTIDSLLKLALVPGPMVGSLRISIPEQLSLLRFRQQSRQRSMGRNFLRALAQAIASAVGAGAAVGTALGAEGKGAAPPVDDELAAYFSWVAKRQAIFLMIDNLQFLNLDVRLTLESVIQRVGKQIRLIALDRTVGGASELDPPVRCFSDALLDLHLDVMTPAETQQLVAGAFGSNDNATQRLAADIFTKTGGLPKDIEYCLRQYALELGGGASVGAIEGLLSTIDRLPLIHRQFLVIAALLDGGVKKAIARGTVSRLASAYDRARLDEIVEELVARDYLRLNSESGDRLRPGHERIVVAIQDLADDDLHEEVRRSLIEELTVALDAHTTGESETYLLHCLVGLQTARELARNVQYIARLIQSQHRQDQFAYLVAISQELHEILPLLPEHVLNDLLDAMQKSSAFEQGLAVVSLLDGHKVPGAEGRRIYRLKYLTQAYRYDEALALSEEIGEKGWGFVYRINALMALDQDAEAREIADRNFSAKLSEPQAVLRRNTVTLYDTDTALRHLDEAYAYFEREQSDFRLATVDTNRGVVHLDAGQYGDALRCLDRARERMNQVGSSEIFQAQINIANRSALMGDYPSALQLLDEAALHVPPALLFDEVKIELNRTVIEFAAGAKDRQECEAELAACSARIRGFQMPYLQTLLESNLAAARGRPQALSNRVPDRVSKSFPLRAHGATWELGGSLHWRY
jgi:tetratricopeptide (TPR) repeat protein